MKDFNQKLTRPLQIKKRVKRKKEKPFGNKGLWMFLGGLTALGVLGYLSYGPTTGRGFAEPESVTSIKYGAEIQKGLIQYIGENDGRYPTGDTVEQCFQKLIDGGYVENETIFWSESGARAGIVSKEKPNNNGILEPGECAWGYVKGLSSTSSARSPLFFDLSRNVGLFVVDSNGRRPIIARVDGSVVTTSIFKEEGATEGVLLEDRDGRKIDIFANLPEGAEIMVPSKFE